MKRRGKIQTKPADALAVECPECSAVAGERCKDGWGAKAPTHATRVLRADGWNRLSQQSMSFESEAGLFA